MKKQSLIVILAAFAALLMLPNIASAQHHGHSNSFWNVSIGFGSGYHGNGFYGGAVSFGTGGPIYRGTRYYGGYPGYGYGYGGYCAPGYAYSSYCGPRYYAAPVVYAAPRVVYAAPRVYYTAPVYTGSFYYSSGGYYCR